MIHQAKGARTVTIPIEHVRLFGNLVVPEQANGLVIFAHGSGSSRFSPRNQFVARALQEGGLATLLMDLLEEKEAENRYRTFDIDRLSLRVLGVTEWVKTVPDLGALPIGYFGASTGAAAALQAAATKPKDVAAIVSRGGRPDLAGAFLSRVEAPTLLIVGGADTLVIELNEEALSRLVCPKQLTLVPGATHLFEEPGTLEEVSRLALDWFTRYLVAAGKKPIGKKLEA